MFYFILILAGRCRAYAACWSLALPQDHFGLLSARLLDACW